MDRLTYDEFAEIRVAEDLRLIDVREQFEFDEVHVKGAELFPLSRIRNGEVPDDDGRRVALICRSGGRSAMAAQVFEQRGFKNVINVEGGTIAAVRAGEDHVER